MPYATHTVASKDTAEVTAKQILAAVQAQSSSPFTSNNPASKDTEATTYKKWLCALLGIDFQHQP